MLFGEEVKSFGADVYLPNFYRMSGGDWDRVHDFDKRFLAAGLTYEHFAKIRVADIVFVYNQNGYVGTNTNIEIGYATGSGKPVYAFSAEDPEVCRAILFQAILTTPTELFEKLK